MHPQSDNDYLTRIRDEQVKRLGKPALGSVIERKKAGGARREERA
jgi:hypothetical protein